MKIIKRIKNNIGGATTILGISIVGLSLVIAVFISDFIKMIYMKNTYKSYAQKAVQTAIKRQDGVGGLLPDSANALIAEYMSNRNGKATTVDGRVVVSGNTDNNTKNQCELKGGYPKIQIKYDNKREIDASSNTYNFTGDSVPAINANEFNNKRYNTIQVKIVDVVNNDFWSIFGHPCSEIEINTSGIAVSAYDDTIIDQDKTQAEEDETGTLPN